jgi:hypothetical protein
MTKKSEPSFFARAILYQKIAKRLKQQDNKIEELETNLSTSRATIKIVTIAGIVMVIAVSLITFGVMSVQNRASSDQSYNQGYDQGYNDATSNGSPDDSTYFYGHSNYRSNNVQFFDPTVPTVQYAIASANPNVLWGLTDPYNDQIVSPPAQVTTGIPFGTPLIACTVYLVTTNTNRQQAVSPVPASQVPQEYLKYTSGCNPASLVPWWVSDQFAAQGPANLPIIGQCNKPSCDVHDMAPTGP